MDCEFDIEEVSISSIYLLYQYYPKYLYLNFVYPLGLMISTNNDQIPSQWYFAAL